MYVVPEASVGASASTTRRSGHVALNRDFEITESAPNPLICAGLPPLNTIAMSAAATTDSPFQLTSRPTTLIRASIGRLVPPSVVGHIRKCAIAAAPSAGVETEPACGT